MQLAIQTAKCPIHARLTLPGAKSITHRALLLSALADGVSELSGLCINKETRALVHALNQLGIVIQLDEKAASCIVAGCDGKFPKKQATIWCGETSIVPKFLLAACAATPGVYYFDGSTSLREKPFDQFVNIIAAQGAQIIASEKGRLPLTLIGADSLEGGEILLDGTFTSQLVSALLMATPFARSAFTITSPQICSLNYVDLTCAIMADFGVLVHRVHQSQFMIPVPQRYYAKDFVIEPDFAIATYFFAAAAVTGGEITIQPTKYSQSKQPNSKFLTILTMMGCTVFEDPHGLTLKGTMELQGTEANMQEFSDSFLALAALAPFAKTPTHITHIGHLKNKEVYQLTLLKTQLSKLGARIETGDDWITIFPSTLQGGVVNTNRDYHLSMAFAILGLKVPGIIINDADCVKKTYPEFFTLWNKLTDPMSICA